jgi:hypothetical protein
VRHAIEIGPADVRQAQRPRRAHDQLNAEVGLEVLDRLADGGVREAEVAGGGAEAVEFDHAAENRERGQTVHYSLLVNDISTNRSIIIPS